MNFRSYPGKVFVVESSKAILRDEKFKELKYKSGEDRPPGKRVGDVKIIPQRTEIKVTDVTNDSGRHTYVFAVSASGDQSYGWTSAMNLEGGFKNETAGLAPAKWDLEQLGTNMTCIDANALIRDGAPDFASRGTSIPVRSFVAVTETSPDGKFVKVSKVEIVDGQMQPGDELGWTKAANLKEGCSDLYFS
ncbi:MAG TPA: hypothetical protein VFT48_13770, partial [Pyrinomonadaceae bacterium]|nr:hypothetical protein [Pyrinomonadaceae bacterium]